MSANPELQPVERRPVVRLHHVADFVGDHVVDRVHRRFDQAAIQ